MVCRRRLPWSAVARCSTTVFVRASVSLKNNTGPRSRGRRDGKRRSVCRYRPQEERPRPWSTRWLLEGSLCGLHDRHDGVFLLLWILESTTREEQLAIAGYFRDPGSPYVVGPGGANAGVIELTQPKETASAKDSSTIPELSEDELRRQLEQAELEQLEQLKEQLETEISMDSVFELLKDQILIDFTALGLRIQIVDKEQRPMFDIGSARLKYYSQDVLHALAPIINKVPNKISVTGHTDSTPYGAGASYTNWELSADRANSARRALLEGTYPEAKVATVQGMGSVAPLLVDKPTDPINRRIAIIVLKKAVSDALGSGSAGLKSSDFIGTDIPPSP